MSKPVKPEAGREANPSTDRTKHVVGELDTCRVAGHLYPWRRALRPPPAALFNRRSQLENRILKSKVKGRLRFTDDERRSLVAAALAMGRKLMRRVVGIVKPDTTLAW